MDISLIAKIKSMDVLVDFMEVLAVMQLMVMPDVNIKDIAIIEVRIVDIIVVLVNK